VQDLLVSAVALLGLLGACALVVQLTAPRSPRRWVEALRVLLLAAPLAVVGYALVDEVLGYRVRRALGEALLVPFEVAQAGSVAFLALIVGLIVRLRAPEAGGEERPDPNLVRRLGWLAVAATLLSLLVVLRAFETLRPVGGLASRWGLVPPVFSEPFRYLDQGIPALVVGVGALILMFWAERELHPRAARVACRVGLVACLLPALLGLGALLSTYRWVHATAVVPAGYQGVISGRGAEIGERVVRAIRESLRERQGELVLPDGTRRRFFLYAGPGAPPLPQGPLDYAKLYRHPSCVLLPLGPAGNRSEASEPYAVHPRRPIETYSPQDLAQGVDRALVDQLEFEYSRLQWNDQPYFSQADDYGYVFTIRRFRSRPRRRARKVFDETLYEIKVLVFRGFYHQRGRLQGPYFHSQFVFLERP
jgi:hypothetical protein